MSQLERAISIANEVHAGQADKAGRPYILHPLRLMLRFTNEDEMITAILHDVIEDSAWTISDLLNSGFTQKVVNAVDCLTKREGESYEDFIERISKNDLAVKVKIEDIKDNLDLSRLESITPKDLDRVIKYHKALQKLESVLMQYHNI